MGWGVYNLAVGLVWFSVIPSSSSSIAYHDQKEDPGMLHLK